MIIKKLKSIATNVAISFFFTAIFVLCYYYFIDGEVSSYISLINITAVNRGNIEERIAEYDFENKSLIKYPSWGSKFGTLKIDSIKLSLPIYHGDNLKILRKGAGHYAGSYFPGEGGGIILAAHNTSGFFKEIDKVKKGDIVTIEATYGTFKYKVYDYKIVKESNEAAFKVSDDEEILIMYTCYPINRSVVGRKTKRYVVYALRVGDTNE